MEKRYIYVLYIFTKKCYLEIYNLYILEIENINFIFTFC